MEARVAVLEQIAKDTRDSLQAIRAEMREGFQDVRGEIKDIRGEIKDIRGEIKELRVDQKSDFRWLLGLLIAQFGALAGLIIGLAGLIAHAVHWF